MKEREERRRAQILRAVAQCVAEEGIDGATFRKIARRANVSTGMVSYYFENKKDLVKAARAAAADHFSERSTEILGEGSSRDTVSDLRHIEALFQIAFPSRDQDTPP